MSPGPSSGIRSQQPGAAVGRRTALREDPVTGYACAHPRCAPPTPHAHTPCQDRSWSANKLRPGRWLTLPYQSEPIMGHPSPNSPIRTGWGGRSGRFRAAARSEAGSLLLEGPPTFWRRKASVESWGLPHKPRAFCLSAARAKYRSTFLILIERHFLSLQPGG
jgi:hypothetical protein